MANLWDEGDIADAITKAKNIGAIFIVFIKGDDELSEQYENLLGNDEILLKLKSKHFVAIKVQQNTIAHQQFSAIYPNNSLPSIFFIGKNGKPLEIITENINLHEFITRIDNIIHKSGIILQQGSVSERFINNEQQEMVPNTVATTSLSASQNSAQSSGDLTSEKKIEYARGLIEQKKEEKQRQEEEEEKLREIERRKVGQNIQQMKKLQHEEELKQLMEERDKEKRENKAARDRVLAQIAQDKAERASKFSKQITTDASQSVAEPKRPSLQTNITKLQFRLPDGSSHTKEFQISDSLEIVHQYVQNEMHLPFTNYTLSTTFPRREFNTQESSQSLLDLQLVPNAVILILPLNQVVSASTTSFIGGMFGWLMTPLLNVYKFLVGFLFSGPPTSSSVEPSNAKRPASKREESSRNFPKKQANDSTVIKRQGNVHRLTDRPDSDDDNNTWNGNSTQQM